MNRIWFFRTWRELRKKLGKDLQENEGETEITLIFFIRSIGSQSKTQQKVSFKKCFGSWRRFWRIVKWREKEGPFFPTRHVPFVYPLKTSENQRFYYFFRRYTNGTLVWNGLIVRILYETYDRNGQSKTSFCQLCKYLTHLQPVLPPYTSLTS